MENEVTSFEGKLLLEFQALLENLVPEIRYINEDLGQLEFYDIEPSVSWPCALLDVSDTQYADLLNGVQEANMCVVAVRVGFKVFSRNSNLQPDAVKAKGLYINEVVNKIYTVMQGWTANGLCSPLTRIRKTTEQREDPFKVKLMLFTTAFMDDSAQVSAEKKKPTINLDVAFGQIEEND